MTLQEWKAQMGRGASAPSAPAAPTPAPDGELDANYHPDPDGNHLSLTEDPSRYIGHVVKGAVHSPLDLVKNFVGAVSHPYDALTGTASTIAHAIKNPSETLQWLNTHPDEVGSLGGQLLLGEAAPGAIDATLAKGPSVVGRGMSAVGRGVEAAGDVAAKTTKRGIVPLVTAATGHPWLTAAELAAPPVLRGTGRLMQRGGAALEGLDLSVAGLDKRFPGAPPVEVAPLDPEAATVRETVNTAREAQANGASRKQAAARAGWPLGKSEEVPYASSSGPVNADLFPYQKEALAGLREAVLKKGDSAWAGDASAIPVVPRPYEAADYAFDNAYAKAHGQDVSPQMEALAHGPVEDNAFTGKSAKLADTADSADELGSLLDAIHGEDAPVQGNGTYSPLDRLARLSRDAAARYNAGGK